MPVLDIRRLRYFLAIVEEGSFSRAAIRLGVAQPALSQHVKAMEESLGTTLLLRGATGVTATEAGNLLASRARSLIVQIEQSEEDLRCLGREPVGTVRLGLPGTISGILTVPLISRCRDRYPGIKIIVAEAMSGFIRDWIFDGQIELGILYARANDPGTASTVLVDEELVLLTAASREYSIPPRDILQQEPLILPSNMHGLRQMLAPHLRNMGLDAPQIEVDSYQAIKQLVSRGYGCSILPRHAVTDQGVDTGLAIHQFQQPRIERTVWLSHSTLRPMTRATAVVTDLIGAITSDLISNGIWAGATGRMSGEFPLSPVPQNR